MTQGCELFIHQVRIRSHGLSAITSTWPVVTTHAVAHVSQAVPAVALPAQQGLRPRASLSGSAGVVFQPALRHWKSLEPQVELPGCIECQLPVTQALTESANCSSMIYRQSLFLEDLIDYHRALQLLNSWTLRVGKHLKCSHRMACACRAAWL